MSIEINDLTNYYKWVVGSSGQLNLAYQYGGDTNMQPVLSFAPDGTYATAALGMTANAGDTNAPVLVSVDANGKLQRAYALTNTVQNNFSTLQSNVNTLSLAQTATQTQVATVSSQVATLNTNFGTMSQTVASLSQSLPSQVATLTQTVAANQSAVTTLQGQNLNARVGVLENNAGMVTSAVNTLTGQNLNSRLATAENYVSTLNAAVATLQTQNLNNRLATMENANLDVRISQVQAVLGAISTADANLINQYNSLYAAVHDLQLQVAQLTNVNNVPNVKVTQSQLFYVVLAEGALLLLVIFFLITRRK